MANNQELTESVAVSSEMRQTVKSVRTSSPTEQVAQDHPGSELSLLSQHRLTRLLQSTTPLPKVLWCGLLVGGGLTIVSACTFRIQEEKLHALQVFSLSLLISISLSLIAIADIHRPFHGLIHVRDYAFQRALQSMNHNEPDLLDSKGKKRRAVIGLCANSFQQNS